LDFGLKSKKTHHASSQGEAAKHEMKGRVSKDEGIASSITEDSRLKYKILFRDFLNFVFCGFALRRCVMSFFAF